MPTKDTIYAASLLGYLVQAGACEEAIDWIRNGFEPVIDVEHILQVAPPDWIVWAAGRTALAVRYRRMIPRDVFDRAAAQEPYAALAYAPHLLNEIQISAFATRFPVTALRCARNFLPDEIADDCRAMIRSRLAA